MPEPGTEPTSPQEDSPRRRLRPRSVALGLAVLFLFWFVPPVYRLTFATVTVTRWDKKKGRTEAVVGPSQKGWITTKRVSHHVLHAIIASEDGKFYQHHGIDWESTVDSARYNWRKGRYARGASTISQQVVKMAFLDREKSLVRKAREAVGVTLMEMMLSKDKILEWYINLAEFGDGVYGIDQGAWHYFKTKPELLTVEQAVHLALVLPSPNAWSGGLRRHQLTKFGQKRYAAILNNLKNSGYITRTQWIAALSRGDFGRPIAGYESLLAAEESHKELCPGSPGCPEDEEYDEALDETSEQGLTFPEKGKHDTPPVEMPAAGERAPGLSTVAPGGANSGAPAALSAPASAVAPPGANAISPAAPAPSTNAAATPALGTSAPPNAAAAPAPSSSPLPNAKPAPDATAPLVPGGEPLGAPH